MAKKAGNRMEAGRVDVQQGLQVLHENIYRYRENL